MKRQLFPSIITVCFLVASCGGSGSSTPSPPPPPPPPPPSKVSVTGTLTYDFVPYDTGSNGLNYAGIEQKPVRGVIVEVQDSAGALIAGTTSGDDGTFSFSLDPNINVQLVVKAQSIKTTSPSWDVSVTDFTNGLALYEFKGSLTSSGTADSVRDVNIPSGWTGASYGDAREAAPFAILDTIYGAMTTVSSADASIGFGDLNVHWSVDNKENSTDPLEGDAQGVIGNTRYVSIDPDMPISGGSPTVSVPSLFVLGDENANTDEYDSDIILKEWSKHLIYQTSGWPTYTPRFDYDPSFPQDPIFALSEGLAHTLAAIISGDEIIRDSRGVQQSTGIVQDLESDTSSNSGWFNVTSNQSILYDVYDNNSDGTDAITLDFSAFLNALKSPTFDFDEFVSFPTIFSFSDVLKSQNASDAALIDQLMTGQNINGTGPFGEGETNDGGLPSSLPVYKIIPEGNSNPRLEPYCVGNTTGISNDNGTPQIYLENSRYTRFTIPANDPYTIGSRLVPPATSPSSNYFPTSRVFFKGGTVDVTENGNDGSAVFTKGTFQTGAYIAIAGGKLSASGKNAGLTDWNQCFEYFITRG